MYPLRYRGDKPEDRYGSNKPMKESFPKGKYADVFLEQGLADVDSVKRRS